MTSCLKRSDDAPHVFRLGDHERHCDHAFGSCAFRCYFCNAKPSAVERLRIALADALRAVDAARLSDLDQYHVSDAERLALHLGALVASRVLP